MTTHVVIMAGGQGTRLFPLSTAEKPKQFLDLADRGRTLIQLTYDRFIQVDPKAHFWVVTAAEYVPIVQKQLPALSADQILAEPEARNTAPCIALACWKIKSKFPNANIVVSPSDAFVSKPELFAETIRKALSFTASRNAIVTVGIKASEPHTGYGYIQKDEKVLGDIHKVLAFKEKPTRETAEEYLRRGDFLWNAGIFIWNADTIEAEFRRHAPSIAGIMDVIAQDFFSPSEEDTLARLFPTCERISIDYAIMEKSESVYTICADWPWSDLGSFAAIEAVTGKSIPQSIKDAQDAYQAAKLSSNK